MSIRSKFTKMVLLNNLHRSQRESCGVFSVFMSNKDSYDFTSHTAESIPSYCLQFYPQTKSCSSFPEWLRRSLRPERIFWAGGVRLCSTGIVFVDGAWLCPALCLMLGRVMLRSAWRSAATFRGNSFVVLGDAVVAVEVEESSPSMYCTTSRGLGGMLALPSEALVSRPVLSQWTGEVWESLWVPGSGEELRLLSALPGPALASAAGCLTTRPGLANRAAGLWCR